MECFEAGGGGDCQCRKWVWSSCDSRVWPFPLQVIHMSIKLYLSHTDTQEAAQAHVTIVCKVKSQPDSCRHTHKPPGHWSTLHSALTRVSRGIKEALRAKQKCSTCFLEERKHKRRGRLFLRWFKVLERKCVQNDCVDSPRVLSVFQITQLLQLNTLLVTCLSMAAVTCGAERGRDLHRQALLLDEILFLSTNW